MAALGGAPVLGHLPAARGQDAFPNRLVRLIVPFAPGGSTDLVARICAEKLSRVLEVPVIVENRTGAGTVVGTDYVAKSIPDGYTLLFGTSAHAINASLYPKLPYDPVRSLMAVSLVAEIPLVLGVNPNVPAQTAVEFVELLRKNPGKYSFASAGNGSALHMAGELLKYQEKLAINHIPYRGAGPALADVVSGQVDFIIDAVSTSAQFIKAGRLKALAVTSERRSAVLPAVPTMKEAGFVNYTTTIWNVVLLPTGTPPDVAARLAQAFATLGNDPELRQKLNALGAEPLFTGPSDAQHRLSHEIAEWRSVIKAAGIKPD